MNVNFFAVIVAAFVPLLLGFIWYSSKVFGKAWMEAAGLTDESLKGRNMAIIFGLSLLFSFMLAFILQSMVIHQFAFFSLLENQPGMHENPVINPDFLNIMAKYGTNFRTFKHGALHGTIIGLFFVLPLMGTSALFERRSFKYILINVGYWTLSFAIMGAILDQSQNLWDSIFFKRII